MDVLQLYKAKQINEQKHCKRLCKEDDYWLSWHVDVGCHQTNC